MIARGLGGLEAWAGTTGSPGGAVCGNAHYGGRMFGDHVAAVSVQELTGDPLLSLPGFRIGKNGVERWFDLPLRGRALEEREVRCAR